MSPDKSDSCKDKYRCAKCNSPARRLDAAEDDPELYHDTEDSDERSYSQNRPKTPVKLCQVFTITVFDIEECKAFDDGTTDAK